MKVTHVATGEVWDVPTEEVRAGRGGAWIDARIAEREASRRAAEIADSEQVLATQQQFTRLTEMESLVRQQAETIARLEEQNQKLAQASPDAAAGAMALMSATAQAQQLRTDLQKDMGAIAEWRQKYNEDVSLVADQVRRRDRVLDSETDQRRDESRRLFDQLRVQQGLAPAYPELLEGGLNGES